MALGLVVDAPPRPARTGRRPALARSLRSRSILERAGAYVTRYGESFRNLVAEEAYRQVVYTYNSTLGWGTGVRNLRSDVVFVRLPGPIPWYTFRDVYAVDGRKVKDRTGRLERLFTKPSSSAREQAQAILAESTRYNLGEVHRNVNAPTIALLFLLPENQARLVFERKGSKTIAGFLTLEVTFQERTRPTLVQDRWQEDVPASGSFWIDPCGGRSCAPRSSTTSPGRSALAPRNGRRTRSS